MPWSWPSQELNRGMQAGGGHSQLAAPMLELDLVFHVFLVVLKLLPPFDLQQERFT